MSENKDKGSKYNIFISNSTYPDAESLFIIPKSLQEIKDDCYVVLDTNALLVPYATSTESLKQIQSTYSKLVAQYRLRIPGQVAREFLDNRAKKLTELYQHLSQKQSSIQLPKEGGKYPLLESIAHYEEFIQAEAELQKKAKEYRKAIKKLLAHIESWNWDDPVSKIYSELFSKDVVLDLKFNEEQKKEIEDELENNKIHKLPPAYKDYSKEDKGVGDLLIWQTILHLGITYKKSVIFVSGDEKPDWWYRSNDKALYPRYELVDKFRCCSGGEAFHIIGLSTLLKMYGVDENVIEEVEEEEEQIRQRSFSSIASERSHLFSRVAETAVFLWLKSQFKDVIRISKSDNDMDYNLVFTNGDETGVSTYVIVTILPKTSLHAISMAIKSTIERSFNEVHNKMFVFVCEDGGIGSIAKHFISNRNLPINSSAVIGYLGEGNRFQEV